MEVITAKQIHEDFYGAEERLYVEAIGLSKGGLVTKASKAERLKKIGFGNAKPIKDCQAQEAKRQVSGHLIRAIEHFRTYYPHNKFITEAEVKRLCEKYHLVLGDASNYIGDMPEKNLQDIENFKLRKEDWKEKTAVTFGFDSLMGMIERYRDPEFLGMYWGKSRRSGSIDYQAAIRDYTQGRSSLAEFLNSPTPIYQTGVDPYKEPETKKEYEQPAFKICAPKEDFNTIGWEVRDGYRLVYDPIVLQPVSKEGQDGYLIITAWGDEASDEIVVNEINN